MKLNLFGYVVDRYNIHTNFHKAWFRSSNFIGGIHTDTPRSIKVLSQMCEAAMSVLMMGRIYEVRRYDRFKWHDIRTKVLPQRFEKM
jgi:hypothetical protein